MNNKDSRHFGDSDRSGRPPDQADLKGKAENDELASNVELPDSVIRQLKRSDEPAFRVPDEIRSGILEDARVVLGRSQKTLPRPGALTPGTAQKSRRRLAGVSISVLAMAILAAVIIRLPPKDVPPNLARREFTSEQVMPEAGTAPAFRQADGPGRVVSIAEFEADAVFMQAVDHRDVDLNGRINILDALALAKTLKTSGVPSERLDQNGDGIIDQKDVDAIAGAVVML